MTLLIFSVLSLPSYFASRRLLCDCSLCRILGFELQPQNFDLSTLFFLLKYCRIFYFHDACHFFFAFSQKAWTLEHSHISASRLCVVKTKDLETEMTFFANSNLIPLTALTFWFTGWLFWLFGCFVKVEILSFTWIYYCIYLLTFPILRLGWIKISLHAIDLLRKNTMAKRLFSQPFTIHFIYPRTLS